MTATMPSVDSAESPRTEPAESGARERLRRFLASNWTFGVLIALYVVVLIVVMAPVLFASVGADDSYWILTVVPKTHNSYWNALWDPLSHAFDFTGQARTTALAYAERNVLGLATMQLATLFSIPPAIIWALVKIALLGALVVALVVFLRQFTFRDRTGAVRRLHRTTIAFLAITLPVAIAVGAKAQTNGYLNGWLFYPTLSYGPLVVFLLLAALGLKLTSLLRRDYRRWLVPSVIVLALLAVCINLAYELLALAIPLTVLVVLLQPGSKTGTWWIRWRAKITVVVAFAGTYSLMFLWLRWRLSQMACHATDSCYTGTVIDLNPRTLFYNFVGAFPGFNGAFVAHQAETFKRDASPDALSVLLAVAAIGLAWAVWASWSVRHRRAAAELGIEGTADRAAERRGLLLLIGVALVIAVGTALITGITERAVAQVLSPLAPYRTGVVTWSALSLAGVAALRALWLTPWRTLRIGALAVASIIGIVAISLYYPRNVVSAQANRIASHGRTIAIDSIHWEIALAQLNPAADKRRCASITALEKAFPPHLARIETTISGAYRTFEFLHGTPYCSTGIGLK